MKFPVLCALLMTLPLVGRAATPSAAPHAYTITADEWAQPRSGAEMAAMAPVRAAVQDWMQHPGYRIVILHSGDEIGGLWSGEVHDWLVALGVPSTAIASRVSGENESSVTLSVEP
ncbi:MAG TPA: hypothetical protein VFM15_06805 [Gammaproteobacteria bacterium]|nr:hypothetical protein [Gammaproteobacteria bacterium]